MDNLIYSYLTSYFNILEKTGNLSYSIVDVLLGVICLNELNNIDYEE